MNWPSVCPDGSIKQAFKITLVQTEYPILCESNARTFFLDVCFWPLLRIFGYLSWEIDSDQQPAFCRRTQAYAAVVLLRNRVDDG